jgi:hypothetical protein
MEFAESEINRMTDSKLFCNVCGREISKEEYDSYDGMCWECWDDQLTEESDSMFSELM